MVHWDRVGLSVEITNLYLLVNVITLSFLKIGKVMKNKDFYKLMRLQEPAGTPVSSPAAGWLSGR